MGSATTQTPSTQEGGEVRGIDGQGGERLDPHELAGAFQTQVAARFDDLNFLDSWGVVELTGPFRAVTSVRVELNRTDYLHLASVVISADGLDDPVQQTERRTSTTWKHYGDTLHEGRLLDPANMKVSAHTRREFAPWLQIDFDKPYDIDSIMLRNRFGSPSLRARGLQVRTRSALDGGWTTRLDLAARERELTSAAERFARRRASDRHYRDVVLRRPADPKIAEQEADLANILASVHRREYSAVVRDLGQIDCTPEQATQFRSAVNEFQLSSRKLEWTSHGVRRSFRHWSRKEKENYVAFANEVVGDLSEINQQVTFGFGSALAVVRDGALIPHDDDIDVLIGFDPEQASTLAAGLKLIEDCLRAKGYTVEGRMLAHRWVKKPGQTKVDVFIGIFEGDQIAWYPGKRGSLTRSMMFPAQRRSFLGSQCAVPREAERYLQEVYGPGWSTPDPNFRHTWGNKDFSDIAK